VFFDKGEEKPIYDHVEDTIPNEYPSRWFKEFLEPKEEAAFELTTK